MPVTMWWHLGPMVSAHHLVTVPVTGTRVLIMTINTTSKFSYKLWTMGSWPSYMLSIFSCGLSDIYYLQPNSDLLHVCSTNLCNSFSTSYCHILRCSLPRDDDIWSYPVQILSWHWWLRPNVYLLHTSSYSPIVSHWGEHLRNNKLRHSKTFLL